MDSWSASSACLVKTLINYSILQLHLHQGWSWPFHQCRRNSRWSFPTNPAACTTCKAGCRSSDQRSSATEFKLPIRILLVKHSMETGGNIFAPNFGVILYNYWVYNFGVILYNYWVYNCITLYIAQPSNHLRYQHTYTILYIYILYIHTYTHTYIYILYLYLACMWYAHMHSYPFTVFVFFFGGKIVDRGPWGTCSKALAPHLRVSSREAGAHSILFKLSVEL